MLPKLTYFAYFPAINRVKIGSSMNPVKRLATLKKPEIGDPEILRVYRSDDFSEDDAHRNWAESRVKGEWYLMHEKEIKSLRLKSSLKLLPSFVGAYMSPEEIKGLGTNPARELKRRVDEILKAAASNLEPETKTTAA